MLTKVIIQSCKQLQALQPERERERDASPHMFFWLGNPCCQQLYHFTAEEVQINKLFHCPAHLLLGDLGFSPLQTKAPTCWRSGPSYFLPASWLVLRPRSVLLRSDLSTNSKLLNLLQAESDHCSPNKARKATVQQLVAS